MLSHLGFLTHIHTVHILLSYKQLIGQLKPFWAVNLSNQMLENVLEKKEEGTENLLKQWFTEKPRPGKG